MAFPEPMRKTIWALLVLWVCAPVQVWGQLPSRRFLQVVPHMVAGDGFVTRVSVVNLSSQLNPVDIHRFNQGGQLVRATGDFLSPGARVDLVTSEAQRFSTPTIEWVAVGSDFPVGVNVFFELKDGRNPTPITAVGFNGQTPTQRLTFPVAFTPAQPYPVDVGIALANVSTNPSTVQLQLRDVNGILRAEKTLQLARFAQTTFVLSASPPFDSVLRAQAPFVGTLGITASQPLAAIGVGVDFGPFFALPPFEGAFPFSASGPSSFVAFVPHIVNGTGFQTFLALVNLSPSDNSIAIDFFDPSGTAAQPLPDVLGPFVLGPGATRVFATGETARFGPSQTRWARIGSSFPLGVNVFFDLKHVPGGNVITAVGFNASDPQTQIVLPVQFAPPVISEPLTLGVALANVTGQFNPVTVRLGQNVAQSILELPPNGQRAFLVSQLPEIAAFLQRQPNFIGSVAIEATHPVVGLGVGDDFGPFFAVPPLLPSSTAILVSISPVSVTLAPGTSKQFTAAVTGTSNQSVTWSANDIAGGNATLGTISTTGLFTAPATVPSPDTVTVKATSAADPTKSGSARVKITRPIPLLLPTTSARPGDILVASATGFDPAAPTFVVFTDPAGNETQIRSALVTSTTVKVAVPVFLDVSQFQLRPGVVSVSVVQETSSGQTLFGPVQNFQIGDLPTTSLSPGQVTLTVLDQLQTVLAAAQQNWQAIETASFGTVNASVLRQQLEALQEQLILRQLPMQRLVNGEITQFQLGQLSGRDAIVNREALALLDRIFIAYLLSGRTAAAAAEGSSQQPAALAVEQSIGCADTLQCIRDEFNPNIATTTQQIFDKFDKLNTIGAAAIGVAALGVLAFTAVPVATVTAGTALAGTMLWWATSLGPGIASYSALSFAAPFIQLELGRPPNLEDYQPSLDRIQNAAKDYVKGEVEGRLLGGALKLAGASKDTEDFVSVSVEAMKGCVGFLDLAAPDSQPRRAFANSPTIVTNLPKPGTSPTARFSFVFNFLPNSPIHASVITANVTGGPAGGTVLVTTSWGASATITLNGLGLGSTTVRTPNHTGCFAGSVSASFGGQVIGSLSSSCF